MPILGGHRPHKNADQSDIDQKNLDQTHKEYLLSHDIASQLPLSTTENKHEEPKKDEGFLRQFLTKLSQWNQKESTNIE